MARNDKRRWPRVQFTMFSMLVLMSFAALGVNLYLKYYLPYLNLTDRKLVDGFAIRFQTTKRDDAIDPDDEILNGLYVTTDKHGRVFCKGHFYDNYPSSKWTIYHPAGRAAFTGVCIDGQRAGAWTGWHTNGHKALELEHGVAIDNTISPQEFYHHSLTSNLFDTTKIPIRHGRATWWWNNGHKRAEGHFENNERQGQWKFYDRSGKLTASGEFDGLRQGAWNVVSNGKTRTVNYVNGRRIDDISQVLEDLRAMLDSPDVMTVEQGFAGLKMLGEQSLPILIASLKSDSRHQRLLALETLGQFGEDAGSSLSLLREIANDSDPIIQANALHAICSIDPGQASNCFRKFVELIKASRGTSQRQIVQLAATLEDILFPEIETFISDSSGTNRMAALWIAIAMYKNDTDNQQVLPLLERIAQENARTKSSVLAKNLMVEILRLEIIAAEKSRDL